MTDNTDNTVLSPTIHEALIFRYRSPDADPLIENLIGAVRAVRESCTKALKDTQIHRRRTMLNEVAREAAAREAGRAALAPAMVSLNAVTKQMANELDNARQRVRPPKPRDVVSELRMQFDLNRLATMKTETRLAVLSRAVKEGRNNLVAAVLSDDLSDMTESERAMLAHEWARRHRPDDLKKIDRYEKALDDAMRIAGLADQFVEKLTDAEIVSDGLAAEKAAKATAHG